MLLVLLLAAFASLAAFVEPSGRPRPRGAGAGAGAVEPAVEPAAAVAPAAVAGRAAPLFDDVESTRRPRPVPALGETEAEVTTPPAW